MIDINITKKIHEHFLNMTLKEKLLIYFLLIVMLPTSIISLTVYRKSINIINNNINSTVTHNLSIIDKSLNQKSQAIYDILATIYLNSEFQDILANQQQKERHRSLSIKYPSQEIEIIEEISSLSRILENYTIKSIDTTIYPSLYIYNRPEYTQQNISDKLFDLGAIIHEKWYQNIPVDAKFSIVGRDILSISNRQIETLKFAKKIYSLNSIEIPYSGLLTIDVGINYFKEALIEYKLTPNSNILLINNNGQVLLASDDNLIFKDLDYHKYLNLNNTISQKGNHSQMLIEEINNKDTIISYKKSSSSDMTIMAIAPLQELNGELVSFNKTMILVLAITLISAVLIGYLLSKSVTRPISTLVDSMSQVKEGNFNIKIKYDYNNEFSYLIDHYNHMMERIRQLIDKLYISNIKKKEAELKALQAQINPHFLYNTLDSINWIALANNVPDISTMVTSLSDFFRYSLSKGENIITLEKEKNQIESYMTIQKVRFKEILDYKISFDENVLDCLTVKLILQPLVENSIIHGIEPKGGKGHILITAHKTNKNIEIRISDDGIGCDIEYLNQLLINQENNKSYGIQNVNQRIKNLFGLKYGISYQKNRTAGITAMITIPAIKDISILERMEEYNVKNDNS